jgi:hypothetical protein
VKPKPHYRLHYVRGLFDMDSWYVSRTEPNGRVIRWNRRYTPAMAILDVTEDWPVGVGGY